MVPLPFPLTDELKLADWLELEAVVAADQNSSIGDLERVLTKSDIAEEEGVDLEEKYFVVLEEINFRIKAAGDAYPFSLAGTRLTFTGTLESHLAYLFCLAVSYLDWEQKGETKAFPERLFEYFACAAAQQYVCGAGVRFAAPRAELPSEFDEAVEELCELIKEGIGFNERPVHQGQDRKLDIVVWKEFRDEIYAKLVIFGQCASGKNWESKAYELDPAQFCKLYMHESPRSRILRALFVPHRISEESFEEIQAGLRGLIFERCRIASLMHPNNVPKYQQALEWLRSMVNTLKQPPSGGPIASPSPA